MPPVHQPEVPAEQQFGYQPALDGLRGVAVTLVLCFHGGFAWMAGGYVGVSVFFTLSGYLITSLLILERGRTGRVSWTAFVTRRAKRLLPASLLCLVAISLLAWNGEFAGVPHLRRDILAATLQVANWNSLHGSGSYADLLTRSAGLVSPLEHYWSLAVEEQFYWVWPFAFALLARLFTRRARLFAVLAASAVAGGVAARFVAVRWGPDAAYWATPARLGEILVGAALAAGCLRWPRRARWLGLLGVAGLGVVLWAAITWPANGGPAYEGWLGLFALASAALILGLQAPGPLRAAFSSAPLVWLGRISYGVYVFHWPVFVLATRRAVHLDGWPLFALRISITLAVAMLSYWLVERPVRFSAVRPRAALSWGVPATALTLVIAVLVVPLDASSRGRGDADALAIPSTTRVTTQVTTQGTNGGVSPVGTGVVPTTAAATTTEPAPDGPINLLLIGDSTAQSLNDSVAAWAAADPQRQARSVARLGCGLIGGSTIAGDTGNVFSDGCDEVLTDTLPGVLADQRPDVAMILVTLLDVTMRQWEEGEGMLSPADDRYAERMLAAYRSMARQLIAAGVRHIAWVVPPHPAQWWLGWKSDLIERDSWDRLDAIIQQVGGEFPDAVKVVRLDEWLTDNGLDDSDAMRTDGLHFTAEGGALLMRELFGPVLLRLAAM